MHKNIRIRTFRYKDKQADRQTDRQTDRQAGGRKVGWQARAGMVGRLIIKLSAFL
jgi:hypothetical protein